MKKILKSELIIAVLAILMLLVFSSKSNASYSIDNVNITANVNENGSLDVTEKIEFDFLGKNYEASIGIPKELSDREYETLSDDDKLDISRYKVDSVKINNIYLEDSKDKPLKYTEDGYGGMNNAYTVKDESKMYIVKIYKSSLESKKTVVIDYTIENICQNHSDYGELYYNFIENESLSELNIDLYLPRKNKTILTWKHGSAAGKYKILSNDHVNYNFKNIRLGEYATVRLLFDKKCISDSENHTGITAKDSIFKSEDMILTKRSKRSMYEIAIYILSFVLIAYGGYAFSKFVKRKDNVDVAFDEKELLEKYNEIVLGCMYSKRKVVIKDIIANILKLIDLGYINIEGKDGKYILSKNSEKEKIENKVDKVIFDLVFEENEEVDIKQFINDLEKKGNSIEKIEKVQKGVNSKSSSNKINILKMRYLKSVFNIAISICSMVGVFLFLRYQVSNLIDIEGYIFATGPRMLAYEIIAAIIIVFSIINLKKIFSKNDVAKDISNKKAYIILGIFLGLILFVLVYSALMPFSKYMLPAELLLGANLMILVLDNILINIGIQNEAEYLRIEKFAKNIKSFFENEDNLKDIDLVKKYLPYEICLFDANDTLKKVSNLDKEDKIFKLIKDVLIKN